MVESSRCGGTALRNLSGDKGTILVVDDEASIRRILQTRLEMIGYSVVTASDGEEALSAFRLLTPDLIVLDVMMPKLDGYGVCQELRKQSDVPIIMLTALADVADRITGLELGADDYMAKPFSPKELESRIRSLLRRRNDRTTTAAISNLRVMVVDNLKIDTNKRQVYKADERIALTGVEYSLVESVTVPFFADQPIWGEKLTRLGVSAAPIPYKKLSQEALAEAIEVVLGNEVMKKKAQELGQKLRGEDGVTNAVEAFHRHLGLIE